MESDAWPMNPERILADLRQALPRNSVICTDVGWNKNGLAQQYPVYEPGTIFTPGGFATMGFGSPAALGAKLAMPDRVVVALVGDGGFGQNPAVLATAFVEDIPVIWVIMNNHAFGTIAGLELAHFGTTFGTVFEKDGESCSPDFAAIARAYGVEGVRIESAAELKPAIERAIQMKQPVVIDVHMKNIPTPTAGHWNIMDIYSPGKQGAPRGHRLSKQTLCLHRYGTAEAGAAERWITTHPREGTAMATQYSLAHLTVLGCPPPEMTYIAARAGYDFVSLRPIFMGLPGEPNYALADNPAMLKQTKRALAETGIKLHDIELARIYDHMHPTKYLPAMEVAAELGGRAVLSSIWTEERDYAIDKFGEVVRPGQGIRPDRRPRVRAHRRRSFPRGCGPGPHGREAGQRRADGRHPPLPACRRPGRGPRRTAAGVVPLRPPVRCARGDSRRPGRD